MDSDLALPPVGGPMPATTIEALWLDVLNRLVGRAAHELRGALNGVSVNLEVVRSRSEKPDVPASAVQAFAQAAIEQLGDLIEMQEALIVLVRAPRPSTDIGRIVSAVGSLLVPAAGADGRELRFEGAFGELGVTSAVGNAVGLITGAVLLATTDRAAKVICRAVPDDEAPRIQIEWFDGGAASLPSGMIAAMYGTGIRVQAEPSAISITFPRSSRVAENA